MGYISGVSYKKTDIDYENDKWTARMECRIAPTKTEGKICLEVNGACWSQTYGGEVKVNVNLACGKTVLANAVEVKNKWVAVEIPSTYAGKSITVSCNWNALGSQSFIIPNAAVGSKLSVSKGIGVSSVSLNRTTAASALDATGTVSADSWVYPGDVIAVTAEYNEGYEAGSGTGDYTVTLSDHAISVTATLLTYSVAIAEGTGTTLSVTRKDGTAVADGDAVNYGDDLTITASTQLGYKLSPTSAATMGLTTLPLSAESAVVLSKVTANVTVVAYAEPQSTANIGGHPYLIYIYHNGSYELYQANIYTNGAYAPYF